MMIIISLFFFFILRSKRNFAHALPQHSALPIDMGNVCTSCSPWDEEFNLIIIIWFEICLDIILNILTHTHAPTSNQVDDVFDVNAFCLLFLHSQTW